MRKILFYLLLIPFIAINNSCETEEEASEDVSAKVNFKVSLSDGQNMVHNGETILFSNNQEMNISTFRMYITDISFVPHSSNSSAAEQEMVDVVLVNPGEAGENTFSTTVKAGRYASVKLNLGLDAASNDLNPTDFDDAHPLSLYQSMYWSMLKYRFVKFEAKVNEAGKLGTASDVPVAYHTGTDALYQNLELSFDIDLAEKSTNELEFIINLDELFAGSNPFDFTNGNEAQSHSSTSDIHIAQKFMQNLKASMSVSVD